MIVTINYQVIIWNSYCIPRRIFLKPVDHVRVAENGKVIHVLWENLCAPCTLFRLIRCSWTTCKCFPPCRCSPCNLLCTKMYECGGNDKLCENTLYTTPEEFCWDSYDNSDKFDEIYSKILHLSFYFTNGFILFIFM